MAKLFLVILVFLTGLLAGIWIQWNVSDDTLSHDLALAKTEIVRLNRAIESMIDQQKLTNRENFRLHGELSKAQKEALLLGQENAQFQKVLWQTETGLNWNRIYNLDFRNPETNRWAAQTYNNIMSAYELYAKQGKPVGWGNLGDNVFPLLRHMTEASYLSHGGRMPKDYIKEAGLRMERYLATYVPDDEISRRVLRDIQGWIDRIP